MRTRPATLTTSSGSSSPTSSPPTGTAAPGPDFWSTPSPRKSTPWRQWLFSPPRKTPKPTQPTWTSDPHLRRNHGVPCPHRDHPECWPIPSKRSSTEEPSPSKCCSEAPNFGASWWRSPTSATLASSRSVLLQIDCGYFIQESLTIRIFGNPGPGVCFHQTGYRKNENAGGHLQDVGKRQGYTVDIVKQIVESIIATPVQPPVSSPRPQLPTRSPSSLRLSSPRSVNRNLQLFTRSSLDEHHLGTVIDDCGDNMVIPNIHIIHYGNKKEIVI